MKISLVILFSCLKVSLFLNGDGAGDVADLLVFHNNDKEVRNISSCQGDEVSECKVTTVQFRIFEEDKIELPGELILHKQRILQENGTLNASKSISFVNDDGGEAVFTFRAGSAFGYVEYPDGAIYLLQNCGEACHVWIKTNDTAWPDEDPIVEIDIKNGEDEEEDEEIKSLVARGKSDRSTIVYYSVMIYYTPEFRASTPDIRTFIDQMIAETNQGYINSNIPIRIKAHCVMPSTLHDNNDGGRMLTLFQNWKSKTELLNSADAAALLVNKFEYCGIGNMAGYKSRNSFTVTMKSCALGHFTFGHELGHNLGAHHDKANANNQHFSYGYGKHIGPYNLGGSGYRSIMAYSASGHRSKANYYSSPSVTYRGYITGSSAENNARVITENRFVFAAVGDESRQCNGVGGGGCILAPDTWSGDCSKYVWACTDSRYDWFKKACSTTCKYCSTSSPVNGKWSSWSSWGACSVTCNSGTIRRTRTCTNPPPSNGGSSCSGAISQSKTCNEGSCGSSSCPYTDKHSLCSLWKDPHCTSGLFVSWMDYNCAKTCKCTSGCTPAPDRYNGDCSKFVWACTDSRYAWFKEVCSTTCKYCVSTGSSVCTPAADNYSGDCSKYKWACTDSRYPWFKKACATTCKYCP